LQVFAELHLELEEAPFDYKGLEKFLMKFLFSMVLQKE
jgi:hypothetical protein